MGAALKAVVDSMIVAACRGDELVVPGSPDAIREILVATRFHRVAPLTYVALAGTRRQVLTDALREERDRAFQHHLRVTAVLDELAAVLADFQWLVFKGPVLSEIAHPAPGLRTYQDLDLLIAPSHLRPAIRRLTEAGWNVVDGNDRLTRPIVSEEISLASPAGVLLDLHWSVRLANSANRSSFGSDLALLERRVPLRITAAQLWTFDGADMLIHVCQHAALSGATRLLQLLDADQLARKVEDWDLIVARARAWRATAQVAVVLGRAHRLLETPMPVDLLERLGLSPSFGLIMASVDRRWPISALRQEASLPRLVSRAARPSALRTTARILRGGVRSLVNRMGRSPAPVRRRPADPGVVDNYLSTVERITRSPTTRRSF